MFIIPLFKNPLEEKTGFTAFHTEVLLGITDLSALAIYVYLSSLLPNYPNNEDFFTATHLMNYFKISEDRLIKSVNYLQYLSLVRII